MLGWEPSPDPNGIGYNIYYGTTSHNYDTKVNVGNVTATTVSNLVEGQTYYFAATIYDALNVESGFSNEALYTVPIKTNQPPTLNVIGNLTLNQNAAAQSVPLTGISSGSASEIQTLTVTAVSSNPGLIPNPTVFYSSPDIAGSLNFTPVSNTNGTATITVTVNDGGASNNIVTRSFVVTINPAINLPPTLDALADVTVNENVPTQTVILTGISSGSPNENQPLKITVASSKPALIPTPTVVYSSPNAMGTLFFKPVNNATGTATITVTVNDGGAQSNLVTRTFNINVNYAPNIQPTLDPLNDVSVNENAAAQIIALTGISSGSINEDQLLKVTVVSSAPFLIPTPSISYISPNAAGTLTFKPITNTNGTAILTVTVNDGGTSNNIITRSFTVIVNPNLPPTLDPVGDVVVSENSLAHVINLTGITSGSPTENQLLRITATSSKTFLIPTPVISYTSPNATGSLTFKPVANANGTATITVTVNDGGTRSNLITKTFNVIVTPNLPPTLDTLSTVVVNENSLAHAINLTGITSGSPDENQILKVTAVSSNPAFIPTPTISYTSPNATGLLTFKPVANTNGSASITVTVNDGGSTNNIITRTFNVIVLPNLPPTLNALNDVVVAENSLADVINLSGITSGAPGESQTLKITAVSSKPFLIPTPTVSYTSPNSTGTLTFKPVSNTNGTASITVTVNDGDISNNIITRTFNVTVIPNQPPTLDALENIVVTENVPAQTVALTGISSGSPYEAQSLKITAVSSNPSLIPTPTISYLSPNSTGTLTFKPVSNTNGTATITVTVNDGATKSNLVTRTFDINVKPVINLPPTLDILENISVNENVPTQTVPLTGISSGSTNENQPLKITVTSSKISLIPVPTISYTSPNAAGSLSFKPVNNMTGTAIITVTVNDGGIRNNLFSRTFTITVKPVPNIPPTLNSLNDVTINENVPAQIIALRGISSGSINEAQLLKVTAISSKTSLIPNPVVTYSSPNASGFLTFKPVNNMTGTATILVTVNDGGTKSNLITRSFMVTVKYAPNQPPTLAPLENVVINENAATQSVVLTGISSGSINEAQPLNITVTSSKTSLIPTPKIVYSSPNATALLTFKPVISTSGTAVITVNVNDGGTSNNIVTRTFTVTVNPNLPPTLNGLSNVAIDENSPPHVINLSGITSGAPSEIQTLKITAVSSKTSLIPTPTFVYTSPNSTGILTFKSVNNAYGTATISVTVNDGGTRSNLITKSFVVTVNHTTNLPPTLNSLNNVTINENAPTQIIALSGISSGSINEDQLLKVTAVSSKTSLIPNPTIIYNSPGAVGSLSFKPANNANGTATISVTVNDGGTQSNLVTKSFIITVNHVNIPPTLDPIADVTFNQPPTLNLINDYIVSENAGLQIIPLSGISSGSAEENQKVTIAAVSSDTGLIQNPVVSYANSNSIGSLSFKPVPNASGTAAIKVAVKDSGTPNRLTTQTFIVTVSGQTNNSDGPSISSLDVTNMAFVGQNLIFSVSASGKSQLHYQWKFNGDDITFATNSILYLNHVDVSRAGSYSVVVFNHDGAINSDALDLTVLPSPGSNDLFSTNADPTFLTQTIPLTGITSGSPLETQTLTVTAISSNPALIPNPDVTYSTPKSIGSLTFAPVKGVSGTSIISVIVNDGGASNNITARNFNVTVNPVTVFDSVTKFSLAKTISGDQFHATNFNGNLTSQVIEQAPALAVNPATKNSNLAMLSLINSQPPTIILTSANFYAGQFSVKISGMPDSRCIVESSTNLVDWVEMETNTVPFVFIDYNAGHFGHRYYRTVTK